MMKRNVLHPFLIVALFLLAVAPLRAAEDIINIGRIGSGKAVYTIAIPTLKPSGGAALSTPEPMHSVIYKDLALSGMFKAADNQKFVEEIAAKDQRMGRVLIEEWQTLGTQFLAIGDYAAGPGGAISGTCRLISVVDGKEVMGRQYSLPQGDYRRLAHHMSDDIIFYLSHVRGIAGTKIIYRGPNREIWITDPDGSNQRPLTHDGSINTTPNWGANAGEFYYTSFKDYNPDLCGAHLNDSATWFISRRQGFNLSPDYSATTKLIALALGKDGNQEIYTMDRVGKNARRLTYNIGIDGSPTWSPNGNQIVFSSDRAHNGRPSLYIMEGGGGNQRLLTTQNYYNDTADWSPTGNKIVFTSQKYKGDDFNIYTISPDGSNWRQLTSGADNNEDPSWAPDGEHIVFSSNRGGSYQLYIMGSDGSNPVQITHGGENRMPDWSPYLP